MDDLDYRLEALKVQELERIRVIAQEIRNSFALGFSQALEITRYFTSPQAPAPSVTADVRLPDGEADDDPLATGILDMRSLREMNPSARAQVLAAYGLQPLHPGPGEPDLTETNLANHIASEGHTPPGALGSETGDEGEPD